MIGVMKEFKKKKIEIQKNVISRLNHVLSMYVSKPLIWTLASIGTKSQDTRERFTNLYQPIHVYNCDISTSKRPVVNLMFLKPEVPCCSRCGTLIDLPYC